MFGYGNTSNSSTFTFPSIKIKNISCVYCKHQFVVRDFIHLRGSQIPLLLNCGHPICESCSRNHLDKPCPVCKQPLQDTTKNPLPVNIYLLGLVNVAQTRPVRGEEPDIGFQQPLTMSIRHSLTDQGPCSECGTHAVLKCLQCKVLFCSNCFSKIHGRALQNHQKVFLTENVNNIPNILSTSCPFHASNTMTYYCGQCNTPSCADCVVESHHMHSDLVSQLTKNKMLIADFDKAHEKVAETFVRISQAQKKLRKVTIFPDELQSSDAVEAAINRHFARLHGVLQNVEKRLMDQIYEQRDYMTGNLETIKKQLKNYEEMLHNGLVMCSFAKEDLEKVDLARIIEKLNELATLPCHLVQDIVPDHEKIEFQFNESIVEDLERHCSIKIPTISNFSLLPSDLLPKDYEIDPVKREEFPKLPDTTPTIKSASSVQSIQSIPSLKSENPGIVEWSTDIVEFCHIIDPSCFYVHRKSQWSELTDLMEEVEKYAKVATIPTEVLLNKMYLAKYCKDSKWYRGRVKSIQEDSGNEKMYEIFYIDYGNTERDVPLSQMRNISLQIATVPMKAVKCAIYDISPRDGKWTTDAKNEMIKICGNKSVIMNIIQNHGDMYYVDLFKDPSSDGSSSVSLREALVFLGHASYVTYSALKRANSASLRKFFFEELKLETYVDVFCHHVESPNSIYVQKYDQGLNYINKLIHDMTVEYTNCGEKGIIYVPEVGMPCAAFDYNKSCCFRAVVTEVLGDQMVRIFDVDIGSTRVVKYDSLRRIHNKYMTSMVQAVKVSLRDVKPLPADNDEWNPTVSAFLKRRLENKKLKIVAVEKRKNAYQVFMYLCVDDCPNEYINVNSLLVKEGLAQSSGASSVATLDQPVGETRSQFNPKPDLFSFQNMKTKTQKKQNRKMKEFCKVKPIVRVSQDESATTQDDQDPFKIRVQIGHIVSPECILVGDITREQEIKELNAQMQKFYNTHKSVNEDIWRKDSVCAVYSPKDKSYCRAKILEIKSASEAIVFFYDMGITDSVNTKDIEPLHRKFSNVPAYLFKVKLAGILPCGGSQTWPSLSTETLTDIISENPQCKFYISKVGDTENDVIPVQLWMKQSKMDGPLEPSRVEIKSVNRMLVDEGVALPIRDYMENQDRVLAIELRKQLCKEDEKQNVSDVQWHAKNEPLTSDLIVDESDPGDDSTADPEESVSSSEYADLPPKLSAWIAALPIECQRFVAVTTYVDHDCVFYLHRKRKNQLKLIETTLQKHYQNAKIKLHDKEWNEGDLCIAQYHADDKWYRAQVIEIVRPDEIKVQFVDYGNIEICSIGKLKKRVILGHIPIQATKCVIRGLAPNTPDGKWKTEDLDKIHALIVDKECDVWVLERKADHLVVCIMLRKPQQIELIAYLYNELRMNIRMDFGDSDSDSSPDAIIEGSINNDKPTSISASSSVKSFNELESVDLKNANQICTDLKDTDFRSDADSESGDLKSIGSKSVNLENANLKNADLKSAAFKSVNLENADFESVDLNSVAFKSVDLEAVQCEEEKEHSDTILTSSLDGVKSIKVTKPDESKEFTEKGLMGTNPTVNCCENMSWFEMVIMEESAASSTPLNNSCEIASEQYVNINIPDTVNIIELETGEFLDSTVIYGRLTGDIDCESMKLQYAQFKNMMEDIQENAIMQPVLKSTKCSMYRNALKSTNPWLNFKITDTLFRGSAIAIFGEKWYRAEVIAYEPATETVSLQYVDYGNTENKHLSDVRCIKQDWLSVPVMKIKCRFWDVERAPGVDEQKIIDELFPQLFSSNPLTALIKERHDDLLMDVELYFDQACTKLVYAPLIDMKLFQKKEAKAN